MSELKGTKLSHVDKKFPKIKETLIIYAKNKNNFQIKPAKIKKSDVELQNYVRYYNREIININDDCSKWKVERSNADIEYKLKNANKFIYLVKPDNEIDIDIKNNQFKQIINNNNNSVYYFNLDGKIKKVLFLSETQYTYVSDLWTHISTININKETYDIPTYANGQKPLELINTILQSFVTDNCIVLDFFSGSNTTADALLRYNVLNNTNNHFISIQLPSLIEIIPSMKNDTKKTVQKLKDFLESIGKDNTICEIGKERIRRAGKRIKEEYPDKKIDTGFRVYKLDSSNINKEIFKKPHKTSLETLTADIIKEDRTDLDLFTQVMLENSIELSVPIKEEKIDGHKVYSVYNNYLIACFDTDIKEETVKKLLQKENVALIALKEPINDSFLTNVNVLKMQYNPDVLVRVLEYGI